MNAPVEVPEIPREFPRVPIERLESRIAGRIGNGRPGYPVSRDWEPYDVKCRVSGCPCNRNSRCTMPSLIDINAAGVCQKAIDFKPTSPPRTKPEGD